MKRCEWLTQDEIYIDYHDQEWGVPVHDDRKLFEMLILEGAQAGLSWLTILKRRETYRAAYNHFDAEKMAQWTKAKTQRLLQDPGIIRNKLKVEAAQGNAQAYLKILDKYNSFDEVLWSFVDGKTVQNSWKTLADIPTKTKESDLMAKELKRLGFKFVGSTICYAFMQAVGMVNDHIVSCYRHQELK